MVEFTVIVGSIGVSLLLLAFFLNLFKILMQDNTIYVEIVGKVPDLC